MSSDSSRTALLAASRSVGSVWWYFLVRGLLLLAAGAFMLVQPGLTLVAFAQVIAVLIIMDGALALAAALIGQAQSRFWSIVRGGLMLAAGIFILLQPALVSSVAIKTVFFIVAPFVIIGGVLEIIGSLRGEGRTSRDKGSWVSGLLIALFGILLIVAPLFFGELLVRVLGILAILMAIPLLLLAHKFRSAVRRVTSAP